MKKDTVLMAALIMFGFWAKSRQEAQTLRPSDNSTRPGQTSGPGQFIKKWFVDNTTNANHSEQTEGQECEPLARYLYAPMPTCSLARPDRLGM